MFITYNREQNTSFILKQMYVRISIVVLPGSLYSYTNTLLRSIQITIRVTHHGLVYKYLKYTELEPEVKEAWDFT